MSVKRNPLVLIGVALCALFLIGAVVTALEPIHASHETLAQQAYERPADSNAEALAATAEDFFRTWLLRRNINKAMSYVSANPILGSCMTPDYLDEKKVLSRADVAGVFRKALTHTLKKTPRAKTLSDLIDSSGGIPSEDSNVVFARHRMEQNFQIFTMKTVEDPTKLAYICKFDERMSFRKTVARPNVYYLVATVKTKAQYEPLDFEILWIKHRGRWRILTISTLED